MNFETNYNELDNELRSKLNLDTKQNIDNFFKIDDSSKEGRHIYIEEADPEFIENMLNKPLEEEISIELTIDSTRQKVINIYRKILRRPPNDTELRHHSNMLRYEYSTEEEIENTLKNSDEYKKNQPVPVVQQHIPVVQQPIPVVQQIMPDEYYIETIKRVYDDELKREADENGISTYLKHMKKGMTEEKLRNELRRSPEYRQNFGIYTPPTQTVQPIQYTQQPTPPVAEQHPTYNVNISTHLTEPESIPIVYCMMGEDRLDEIKPYIETILPYVDKFIFIDGSDDTD